MKESYCPFKACPGADGVLLDVPQRVQLVCFAGLA
jgi:hypothetical protein